MIMSLHAGQGQLRGSCRSLAPANSRHCRRSCRRCATYLSSPSHHPGAATVDGELKVTSEWGGGFCGELV